MLFFSAGDVENCVGGASRIKTPLTASSSWQQSDMQEVDSMTGSPSLFHVVGNLPRVNAPDIP